jgi:hypothetical protein
MKMSKSKPVAMRDMTTVFLMKKNSMNFSIEENKSRKKENSL